MLRKEAIAIAGIAWIVCGIHAALPYVFCDIGISFGYWGLLQISINQNIFIEHSLFIDILYAQS